MLRRCLNLLWLIVCLFQLTHCTNVSPLPIVEPPFIKDTPPVVGSPYTKTASTYLSLAKTDVDEKKQSYLILAAGRLIHDGSWRDAQAILTQMEDFNSTIANERHILFAKIEMTRGKPRQAIRQLAFVREIRTMPLYYQIEFHKLLATAYKAIGNRADSLNERIKLGKLFTDETSQAANRRAIWFTLAEMSIPELETIAMESNSKKDLAGWLQLALIAHKPSPNPSQAMLLQLEEWRTRYPTHAANKLLSDTLTTINPMLLSKPKKIALLLPLTGSLSAPGLAIKEGFEAGLRSEANASSAKVHYYDTNSKDIVALYEQAVDDGATIVIGPLSKSDVAKVAALKHPIPTILLNDANIPLNDFAYQFGLSPNQEARLVADKAHRQGHSRALVIAPAGGWGDDIVMAFKREWEKKQGQVMDTLRYYPKSNFAKDIRQLLQIDESEQRAKELKRLLGQQVEVSISRRQDVDVIFLLGYPSIARQMMPLLNYYYAGDIPVYSTSAVYSANNNATKDRDLDGILFCDMPWVFTHQLVNKNWPEQFNSYNRLYALGVDSYALTSHLTQLILFPAVGVNDKNGILYLNSSQQIMRKLTWGQFQHGLPIQQSELTNG